MVAAKLDSKSALEPSEKHAQLQVVQEEAAHEPLPPSDVAALIGDQLRVYYSRLMSEPVPERLVKLLDQLSQGGGANDAR